MDKIFGLNGVRFREVPMYKDVLEFMAVMALTLVFFLHQLATGPQPGMVPTTPGRSEF